MSKAKYVFETFDLAIGRGIALLIGGAGGLSLYIGYILREAHNVFWPVVIGLVLLLIAAALLYWRVTLLKIIEVFASGISWN